MHTLDINLLKGHLRDMFQIDLKHLGGDGASHTMTVKDKMNIPKTYVAKLPVCKKLIVEYPQDLLYKLLEFHHAILYVILDLSAKYHLMDKSNSSVQRFTQQQVPIQAITLDVPLDEPQNMWLSDLDDEDP
ncbi:hypothetical protein BDN71DRAFT_1514261 [Pleurotus eryngii]|uniref:Uncharacterized protein n=1 Tax=Pleurotus eryngii TaxID=5323 RepID=A0A9P6D8U4_PLEER|nr:hypothetical protein BDN71DRAFT_1514261 [Pleurotus eryngii]